MSLTARLTGKKAVIACSEMKSEALASGLRELGAEVTILPVISMREIGDMTALDAALNVLPEYSVDHIHQRLWRPLFPAAPGDPEPPPRPGSRPSNLRCRAGHRFPAGGIRHSRYPGAARIHGRGHPRCPRRMARGAAQSGGQAHPVAPGTGVQGTPPARA